MWFLYEYENGKITLGAPTKAAIKRPAPLADYLKPQGRFKGADIERMEKEVKDSVQRISEMADRNVAVEKEGSQ